MAHTIEEYVAQADPLAQNVVNAWGTTVQAGHGSDLSAEFMELFETTCRYREAKRVADNRRKFGMLTDEEATEEESSLKVFAATYKRFWEKRNG